MPQQQLQTILRESGKFINTREWIYSVCALHIHGETHSTENVKWKYKMPAYRERAHQKNQEIQQNPSVYLFIIIIHSH